MTRRVTVPALERLLAMRAVATAESLDRAAWPSDAVPLRIAPDEVLVIDATKAVVEDPDAIIEPERGYVGTICTVFDRPSVQGHTDWPIPSDRGVLAQGKIAGVPAKVWTLPRPAGVIQLDGDDFLLVVQTCYANELRSRLGW